MVLDLEDAESGAIMWIKYVRVSGRTGKPRDRRGKTEYSSGRKEQKWRKK